MPNFILKLKKNVTTTSTWKFFRISCISLTCIHLTAGTVDRKHVE